MVPNHVPFFPLESPILRLKAGPRDPQFCPNNVLFSVLSGRLISRMAHLREGAFPKTSHSIARRNLLASGRSRRARCTPRPLLNSILPDSPPNRKILPAVALISCSSSTSDRKFPASLHDRGNLFSDHPRGYGGSNTIMLALASS